MGAVLSCEDLTVSYPNGAVPVRGVSFSLAAGACFALVGGSGAGKSTLARALSGLHRRSTRVSGRLMLDGTDMSAATAAQWRAARGRRIGFVAQNPWASCDPLRQVRDHVAEAWRCHGCEIGWHDIATRLEGLGVAQAGERMGQYPHAWSGGMLQRASIAAAGAHGPPILIADEPTSALDADRAQSVLEVLRSLGAAVVLISHDIGLVLRNADRVGVLHNGRLVEEGSPAMLTRAPVHAETQRLLSALAPLPPRARPRQERPLLRLSNVSVCYAKGRVTALAGANLEIAAGQIVGVQGPSGCGKSTLLRVAMGIEPPSSGQLWRDKALGGAGAILPVFQDPVSSLVPHWSILRSLCEPLTVPGRPRLPRARRLARARAALAQVGLGAMDPHARPFELSHGQCQRVALARAILAEPAMIVADEPTSALDSPSTWRVSQVLRAAADRGTAVLIVSHDTAFLERLADRVVTLEAGQTIPAAAP
ncbi:MAG: ATP-binding cassette domain-containing protein [Pseudomonadota bacterium]